MKTLVIKTGSRLHFGLIISGEPGALRFGGIGTMIDSPGWTLLVSAVAGEGVTLTTADGVPSDAIPVAESCLAAIRDRESLPALRIDISESIPRHAGLGSGTQFALALGSAVRKLLGRNLNWDDKFACRVLRRGERSKIGIAGFKWGGLIHHCAETGEPRQVSFPKDWRWVLVRPKRRQGVHGDREVKAFQQIQPMPADLQERLNHRITDVLVPSAETGEFAVFASELGHYGRDIGEFYAEYQGGVMADPQMLSLADALEEEGFPGAAQSSWGPTIAIPAMSEARARTICERVRSEPGAGDWQVQVCQQFCRGWTLDDDD